MTITMFDSIDLSQIPADAPAVAGYVSGKWPTFARLPGMFPHAHLLSIAVTAAGDADCLDIETGDATPADAAGWYARQKAHGRTRPCLYASASVMQAGVLPALTASGIARSAVRLWSAHYTGSPHICGPSSCGAMSIAADGTQWTDAALGRDLDESLLAADFFGPVNWQEAMMNQLPTLSRGAVDKPGEVSFVHRLQALVACFGRLNNITSAACVLQTGTFDAATTTAVKAIQASRKLTVDGAVGPQTWGVLVVGSAT